MTHPSKWNIDNYMKTLLLILLALGSLNANALTRFATADLPDPSGPHCLVYAEWAYDKAQSDPSVTWAAVVSGKIRYQFSTVARDKFNWNQPANNAPALWNPNHALCVWRKNNEIWVEDIQVNFGVPYRCPDLTKLLQSGTAITPQFAFNYIHKHSTDVQVVPQ
jgi:hypothetical protein